MTTVVTGKNQVTIPVEVARALGLQRGSRIEWNLSPGGHKVEILVRPSRGELAGRLHGAGMKYKKSGEDWAVELCAEREREDRERMEELG